MRNLSVEGDGSTSKCVLPIIYIYPIQISYPIKYKDIIPDIRPDIIPDIIRISYSISDLISFSIK